MEPIRKGKIVPRLAGNAASWRRRLSIASGLWLMLFVTTHFLNHALGLLSLAAMEQGRTLFLAFWRSPAVQLVSASALLVHAALALWPLAVRRSWRFPPWQALQILFGLLIPVLLARHLLATGVLARCCGLDDSYTLILGLMWPGYAARQGLLLVVVWVHGCLGLHFWLRLRPGYYRVAPWLLGLAVLLPVLAFLGFVSGGREVAARAAADPVWYGEVTAMLQGADGARLFRLVDLGERRGVGLFLLLLAGLLLWHFLRPFLLGRNRLPVRYLDGPTIVVPRGTILLDASRGAGILHASICGGRGRCSTCRVRVLEGGDKAPPPGEGEKRVLRRIGAAADVRLACQCPVMAPMTVQRLMPPGVDAGQALRPLGAEQGREREITVLFADLRDFTRLAENRLPYDTVFILNRYFRLMGEAIAAAGGHLDKFIGDGIMALFGIDRDPGTAARQALAAAAGMANALERLNRELEATLAAPLRMGIGIHAGHAVLGEMGYGRATGLTAIGDTVNVASRLETLTKEFGAQLVVSREVFELAGIERLPPAAEAREVQLRGREEPLAVLVFAEATVLRGPVALAGDRRESAGSAGRRGWPAASRGGSRHAATDTDGEEGS